MEERIVISQEAIWITDEGEELIGDRCIVQIHAPADNGYLITWEQEVIALTETRHLSSETLHGHYSGLSTRFVRSMTGGHILFPNDADPGETSPPRTASGPTGKWCDYSGRLDGNLMQAIRGPQPSRCLTIRTLIAIQSTGLSQPNHSASSRQTRLGSRRIPVMDTGAMGAPEYAGRVPH